MNGGRSRRGTFQTSSIALDGRDDAEPGPSRAAMPSASTHTEPVSVHVPLDLRSDDGELRERRAEELTLYVGIALDNEAEHRHEHQHQREQREEP
jgi:hypothetical protein